MFIKIGLWLNLVFAEKQRFGKWNETKQINIKNRTYYSYNDITDLKNFDAKLLKMDKKYHNEIDIYYIGYVTVKKFDNGNNITSVNSLYLMIDEMIVTLKKKMKISIQFWMM